MMNVNSAHFKERDKHLNGWRLKAGGGSDGQYQAALSRLY